MSLQGWRVLDDTRFLPRYLPVNTVLGKLVLDVQSGKNWEKHNLTIQTISYINKRLNLTLKYINTEHKDS